MEELLRNPPKAPLSFPEATLYLCDRGVTDRDVEFLARALMAGGYQNLEVLSLARNNITAVGAAALGGALAQGTAPNLMRLSIEENPIGDDGMVAIAKALPKVPKLRCIEAMENNFSDIAVKAFFASGADNALRSIESLYLRKNKMGDDGMEALCKACEAGYLPKCRNINIGECEITDEGCLILADAIEAGHLTGIRSIQLHRNRVGRDGMEVVQGVIKEYDLERNLMVNF